MPDSSTQSPTGWGNFLGAGADALTNYLGNRSATGALTGAEQNAITTQTGVQGQLSGIYSGQRNLGNGADSALAAQLGLGGTPNYAAFNNSPGYQFALAQADQAIDRTAAANGSLYTPNTLAMLSQYNTGYASQNYNNYIGQLMQSAGLGAQGNSGLATGVTSTGANISQLQQNQGNAQAGGTANTTGIASSLLSKVPWGSVGNTVGGWFGNGSSGLGANYGAGATGTPDASSTYMGNGDNSGDPSGWGGSSNPN
jgi:hypothetical protein